MKLSSDEENQRRGAVIFLHRCWRITALEIADAFGMSEPEVRGILKSDFASESGNEAKHTHEGSIRT